MYIQKSAHKCKLDVISQTEFVVQLLSCVQLCATPWIAAHQASLSITKSRSCSNLCPSSQWCNLTVLSSVVPFSSCLQSSPASWSFPMSQLEYWSFSFSISPSNEYSVLISFGIDWFDLLAVQGTLKSLLQHHSSKTSIFRHSAFFTVQLLLTSIHDHWKNHSLY